MSLLLAVLVAAATRAGVSGVVYDDANGSGRRDAGERGLAAVAVSDGVEVAVTGPDGAYRLDSGAGRPLFVIVPGDRRAVEGWWRPPQAVVDFPLAPSPTPAQWRFAHLSDTHIHAGNVERTRRALALAGEGAAELAVVSGDLIKDALKADEATARGEFALYAAEVAKAPFPVWSVLGNHDVFGIERPHLPPTRPAYGKVLYEEVLGPRYYAFNRGRIHFLVLDTVGIDDGSYYGHLDAQQLEWVRKELALVPPETTVVTVGHIPLRSGALSLAYAADGLAQLHTLHGQTSYRHIVHNAEALMEALRPHRWTLALQGHTHMAERLQPWDDGTTRYHTAPAVDRQAWARSPSGIVVYTVRGEAVDDGEVLWLDPR